MVLCIVSLVSAITFINRGFPGFLVYPFPNVGSYGSRDWPGYGAGLKFMDRIVSVDGEPVRNGREVINWTSQKANGTPVHYGIESKGTAREVTIPVHTFGIKDFLIVFVVPFIFGLAVYALGIIVYVLKPNIHSSWVFLIFCFSLGTYVGTGFEIQSSYHLIYIHYLIIPLVPAVGFHLFSIFPDRKKVLNRHPLLEYAIYIPAAFIAAAYLLFLLTYQNGGAGWWIPHPKVTTPVNRIFFLGCALSSVVFLIHSVAKALESVARQRARVTLFGIAVAFLPAVTIHAVVTFLKVNFPWNLMVFLVFFFPASIAYSIVRHNLFDADIIIRRTVGYAVVTVIVVGAYAGVSVMLNLVMGKYELARAQAFPIIFTLGVILVFNPLRNRIQALVDRVFFRKDYDYGEIVEKVGGAMTSLLELPLILKRLVQTFMEDMFINTSSVMLLAPAGTEFQVYLAEGEQKQAVEKVALKQDKPLMEIIRREKRELTKYDVLEDPRYRAVSESCAADFAGLKASLIVPLVYQNQVIGSLNLGEKKSGKAYNREDIELLRAIANQGAVAIQNAKLVDQMKSEEVVRANLARYLSPQIVEQVIKKNVQVNLGGDRKVVTVLFSDIRNFTSISESMPPDKLVHLLNEYFTEMARIIFENQGSLDKYIGDAIVAVFGSLIRLENAPQTAVRAAIQMMQEMSSLNERWKNQYGFRMDIGIGINTGEVFLGNVGSPDRMEFTVIGDTVNIASRFSGVAKGGQILITEETLASLGPGINYAKLSPVSVKGKTDKLEVFEIVYG
jgi:class 3 adenylate cyclase